MRHSRNKQENGDCNAKRNIPEKLGVRDQLSGFKIEGQKISKDWISCVIAEHDHEDALNKMQEPHEQIEAA